MTDVTARDGTRLVVHERGSGSPLLCVPGGPGRASAYLEDLGGLDRAMRPFWYGRWDERTQAHAASADDQVSLRAAAGYLPGDGYDAAEAARSLAAITAEVLIVVGERDALTGVAVAERFAEVLPAAQVARIAGAGHFPWVDEPDSFRAAVTGFLAG